MKKTRHEGFQFGTNPMREDSFEKRLIMQDRVDRKRVKIEQTLGMQGTDGGKECFRKAKTLALSEVYLEDILN
jgi:hypothetical protein